MASRNRIATAAVALSALAFVVPVAGASAATAPVSANVSGQVGSQDGPQANLLANLQAAEDAWKVGAQASLNGILGGAKAAQDGITAGEQGAAAGAQANAQLLGIPLNVGLGTDSTGGVGIGGVSIGLPPL
jgi:hypothetical protein